MKMVKVWKWALQSCQQQGISRFHLFFMCGESSENDR